MKRLSKEMFYKEMRAIADSKGGDTEAAHGAADDLMADQLRALGFGKGVKVFEDMEKWYA